MDDYVSKPLDRAQLRAALDRQAPGPAAPFSEKILRGVVDDEPDELARLVAIFNDTAPGSLAKMREALAAKKRAPSSPWPRTPSRAVAAASAPPTLRELCAVLEKNARDGQLEGAGEWIASAETELHRLSEALIAYTAKSNTAAKS